jgi:hypothetical protein
MYLSAGKSKTTKTTNETEYRAILDTIISDVLTVLYWPEWPGAALLLIVVCKLLVSFSSLPFYSSHTEASDVRGTLWMI